MNRIVNLYVLSLCALLLGGSTVWAGEGEDGAAQVKPFAESSLVRLTEPETDLSLPVQHYRIIELPAGFELADLSDPAIVGFNELELKNRIRIEGLQKGRTVLTFLDNSEKSYVVEITVTGRAGELQHYIGELYPDSTVLAVELRDSVLLRGRVTRPEHVEELIEIAEQFYPKVLNQIEAAPAGRPAERDPLPPQQWKKLNSGGVESRKSKPSPPQYAPPAAIAQPGRDRLRARAMPAPPMHGLHRAVQELRGDVRELRGDVRRLHRLLEKWSGETNLKSRKDSPEPAAAGKRLDPRGREVISLAMVTGQQQHMDFPSPVDRVEMDQPSLLTAKAKSPRKIEVVSDTAGDYIISVHLQNEPAPRLYRAVVRDRWSSDAANKRAGGNERQRIEAALERRVTLHFDETPLKDVVKQLAETSGVNVVLDKQGLQEEGIRLNEPVTLDLEHVNLRTAIKTLLKPLRLEYVVDDEVLKITSRQRAWPMVVVTYPVADLVVDLPRLVNVPREKAERVPGGTAADFDWLVDLIRQTIEPDSWEELGGAGSIQVFETTISLVIRQSPKTHNEIKDLLIQLRRLYTLQVNMKSTYIQNPPADLFQKIGLKENAGDRQDAVVLDAEQARRVVELAQQTEQTSLFDAGSFDLRQGQTFGLPVSRPLLIRGLLHPILVQPLVSAEKRRVQLLLAVRQRDKAALSFNTVRVDVPNGQSVLLELTNRQQGGNIEGVPIEPGSKNFKRVRPNESNDRVFLLLTPKIRR